MNREKALNILGLDANHTLDDVKKAYRSLAKKYHPDRNSGDRGSEEKFKSIVAAYEFLTKPQDSKSAPGWEHFNIFESFMSDLFSKKSHTAKQDRPGTSSVRLPDIDLGNIKVPLSKIFSAEPVILNIPVNVCCELCYSNNDIWSVCKFCNQTGSITKSVEVAPGVHFKQSNMCSVCSGSGWSRNSDCSKCSNKMVYKEICKVKVDSSIISDGSKMVLRGKGNRGWKTNPSNVYFCPEVVFPTNQDLNKLTEEEISMFNRLLKKLEN